MAFHTSFTTKTLIVSLLLLFFHNKQLNGQQSPNRLAVTGGTVMAFNSVGTTIEARQAVSEGEKIRTGEGSFANLTVSNEGSITVGEKSHIEVLRLGQTPMIRLESGSVKVSSQHTDVQIMTRSGVFAATEWPFAMQLSVNEGGVNLDVSEGAVRISELGSGLTVRSPTPSTYRTYVVGGNHAPEPPAPTPVMFPCGGYPGYPTAPAAGSGPAAAPTPAANPGKGLGPGTGTAPIKP